jgi:hypothetical protein
MPTPLENAFATLAQQHRELTQGVGLQAMEIAQAPEVFTPLTLVVNRHKPNAKRQLAKAQKLTLKHWGENG